MKPQSLAILKHGKLLCKKVFPMFVDTWNWLVGAFDSLQGDWDRNQKNGFIHVDRTDPDKPVIRLMRRNALGGAGGGKTEDVIIATQIKYDDDTHKLTAVQRTLHFTDGIYQGYEDAEEPVEIFEAVPHVAHD